jgi:WD repeat-containing protein 61
VHAAAAPPARQVRTIDAGPIEAWTLALSADEQLVASGSQGGSVNLWSVATGEKRATLKVRSTA